MKFCGQCGKTVAILGNRAHQLCPDCTDKTIPKSAGIDSSFDADLLHATFTVENGKIHFISQEGWLLWSGSEHQHHTLQHITNQASRILKIRKRKKK